MAWIWLIIAVVVVAALIAAWLIWRGPIMERRHTRQRAIASELRRQADAREMQAQQHEAVAAREADLAQKQREDAQGAMQRAERVDPDR